MSEVGAAIAEVRLELAGEAGEILPDTCRLIVGDGDDGEYENVPCKLKGTPGNIDGAPYRIRFAWGSPAVARAAVVVDEIPGRLQLTLQLVEPVDSSTGVWQEWRAVSAPLYGRANVGF